jgi:NAD(P)-dependent dehydrogenase (short-subunit alcohol dehydrogenase family)
METQPYQEDIPEVALIIGGHSGIGRETASRLKFEHPRIAQCVPDRTELDVTNRKSIVSYIRERGPFTDIIYSAGINDLGWITRPKIEVAMEDMFRVNCTGFVSVLSVHRRLYHGAGFSAVAVSSDAGRIPMRGSIAYCVSKAALNAAVKVAARELAPDCRVNAVAPGMVEGTMMTKYIDETIPDFRGWTKDRAIEYELSNTPTRRRATLLEIADAIVWVLTGPEQMTGAIIDVNGGR